MVVWSIAGIVRLFDRKDKPKFSGSEQLNITAEQLVAARQRVAVLLPCYNEELVLPGSIESLLRNVPAHQIFVGADGCTDRTAEIARTFGCQVLEINPGQGKASMLEALIHHFNILDRFDYVMMADADAIFGPEYVINALLMFLQDPSIAAIAGYARTPWRKHWPPNSRMFFVGYRARLYRILQWLLTFGWTWRKINATLVVPGFASIYRSEALRQLEIHVPGMVIEDFNLAFQIHKKKIGRIAHHPSIYAIDQDPDNLDDYARQVRRWNIGYWQTVRYNGIWPSLFWITQGWYIFEVLLFSIILLSLPLILVALTVYARSNLGDPALIWQGVPYYGYHLWIMGVFFGLFAVDYLLTVLVAVVDRRYMLLIYGLGFTFVRIVDAITLLSTIRDGLRPLQHTGRWQPPTRYQRVE